MFWKSMGRTFLIASPPILLLVVQFGTQPGGEFGDAGVLCIIGVGVGSMGVAVSIGPPPPSPPSKCLIGLLPRWGVGVGDSPCRNNVSAYSEDVCFVAPAGVPTQGCVPAVVTGVG